ncbi:hydantoinase/oxoprolinase family protein [Nonomuraea typhae]|uniref:hydantoinase/oxoprolinase family protein n=1 Tax=Nonomuraea typhae TaxID=2603600 RepID=UPI0012FBC457|nr:hydantoinase/oxoprolinase family protein [Nonomuraea typhae]
MSYVIAVDVGGTFTDVVQRGPGGRISVAKVLSTHDDPVSGVTQGIRNVLTDPAAVTRVVHATTLATNAILERKGVRVAYVTTRGFRSMIPLGRYARVEEDRYDLRFTPPPPPVAAEDCFEVTERVSSDGSVLTPLDEDSVRRAAREIAARGITSAAVCLLHSYANPGHERLVARILREHVPGVAVSSEIWPEIREYERATTTIMSAYVGPLMSGYLGRLRGSLLELGIDAPVHVMDSGGGVISADLAARRAVATIESGPAAGVLAAAATGLPAVISFDMGGTTAKACLVRDGVPSLTREFHVGGKGSFGGRRAGTGVPIKTPAIDLAEVGAGGGSIAWVDAAGVLRVGPRSAGSSPGPACYARGGAEPTVTDANLVLGYLSSASMPLSRPLAVKALEHVAGPLGVPVEEAALAVHEIVCASMASAVHVVTVQRGIDPRGFTLVAFGGAGPMHACRVAERFGIGRVLVPAHCGVASAAGLLSAVPATERVRSALHAAAPEEIFRALAGEAAHDLGLPLSALRVTRLVDARFRGQAHELTVEWDDLPTGFFTKYAQVYGVAQQGEIEHVSYRVRVTHPEPAPPLRPGPPDPRPPATRTIHLPEAGPAQVPVHTSRAFTRLTGPAVVEDPEATIVIPPGWQARPDAAGAVLLERT